MVLIFRVFEGVLFKGYALENGDMHDYKTREELIAIIKNNINTYPGIDIKKVNSDYGIDPDGVNAKFAGNVDFKNIKNFLAGKKFSDAELLDLDKYRRSPNRGAGASRPKYVFTSPQGDIYFKFKMTNNEVCAELFAYDLAKQLGISIAHTRLARAGVELGIASYDIGEHEEPQDDKSYSVKDFILLDGFVEMCLFDYLIMNEDRHARNWGILDGRVASLFDHNISFGGDIIIIDANEAMRTLNSPFYVDNEDKTKHDILLLYFVKYHASEVSLFIQKLNNVEKVSNKLWYTHLPDECERLNNLLLARMEYMKRKVDEYNARQIDDNEF
jgi:hypothetical protein